MRGNKWRRRRPKFVWSVIHLPDLSLPLVNRYATAHQRGYAFSESRVRVSSGDKIYWLTASKVRSLFFSEKRALLFCKELVLVRLAELQERKKSLEDYLANLVAATKPGAKIDVSKYVKEPGVFRDPGALGLTPGS